MRQAGLLPVRVARTSETGRGRTRWSAETQRLFARYHANRDGASREALVRRFMPLARRRAERYARPGSEGIEDLLQVAYMGLIKAIDRFDPGRGHAFSSFAEPTITGELKRYFRDTGWSMHMPRREQEHVLLVERTTERLSARAGRSPSVPDIAEESGMALEEVLEALAAARASAPVSLDQPVSDQSLDASTLGDTVGAVDGSFDAVEYGASAQRVIAGFSDRDRLVLRLRFVDDLTQNEIAEQIGVSQMQVSRILRRMLEEIRTGATTAA